MKNKLILEMEPAPAAATPVEAVKPVQNTVPVKENKIKKSIVTLLSGRFLVSDTSISNLPFLLYIAFLGLCYIANGYYAQRNDRELDRLNTEIEDLHSRYVIAQSQLMYLSKESEVAKMAAPLGLQESLIPPSKIVLNDNRKPSPR
jgi:hypothetical protein